MDTIRTNAQPSRQSKDHHNGGSALLPICLPSGHHNALVVPSIVPLPWNKFRGRSSMRLTRPPCMCSTREDGPVMENKSSSISRVPVAKCIFSIPEEIPPNTALITATKAPDIWDLFSSMLRQISCVLLASSPASQPPLSSLGAKTHNFYHRVINVMPLANLPSPPFN